jgi:lysophospholipase L1-like esterase
MSLMIGIRLRALKRGAWCVLLVVGAFAVRPTAQANDPTSTHWVGTWTTSPVAQSTTGTSSTGFSNQTLRQITKVSLGGSRVRLRLSNTFGAKAVVVGSVQVGLRDKGAAIRPGSNRPVTFGASRLVTLWPGAVIVSDPVELVVPALAELVTSIYLPEDVPASLPITFHSTAKQTNYISPKGDHTAAVDMPVDTTKESWYFLTGIDVSAPRAVGSVVALGDSLTDGNLSTADTNGRWTDALAAKLHATGTRMGVMNQGTGGGRVLHDLVGESGLHRFDRDVLAQPGVTHVVVLLGVNDLRRRLSVGSPESEPVSADDMIAGYKQLILRAHARNVKVIGGTLIPWENETFAADAYTPEGAAKRQAINAWIRSSGAFDGVMDFDKLLQDPTHPNRMLLKWDSGDHLHPGDAGYRHMGEAFELSLLK